MRILNLKPTRFLKEKSDSEIIHEVALLYELLLKVHGRKENFMEVIFTDQPARPD